MGYANVIPYQQLTIKTGIKVAITAVSTVASSPEIGTFTMPTFTTPLSAAYLDVVVQRVQNDFAGVNYLINGGSFGIMDSTNTTYTKSADISGNTLYVENASLWHSHYVIPGTIDIKGAIQSGASQKIKFKDIVAEEDVLNMLGMYGELRLYFGVG